ncbi:Molybdopterin cofactor biosynthesis C domain-containing protein [Paraphysoderma sedebokerense]|nr:Molybdopterin cofactor biosynthesis C domain-containing protein [Paraphysoderma sedebokerense]
MIISHHHPSFYACICTGFVQPGCSRSLLLGGSTGIRGYGTISAKFNPKTHSALQFDVTPHLTHTSKSGKASMVDVIEKHSTSRTARAEGIVRVGKIAYNLLQTNSLKKGDVLSVAKIAAIQGAKKTSDLIPLCHPVILSHVIVNLELSDPDSSVRVTATAKCKGETGVEMEALTAVSVACLTVYDMCKAVEKGITIEGIRITEKSGGKSGDYFIVDNQME